MAVSRLLVESKIPVFGENYKIGYIGFTYNNFSIVSRGIAYVTRWARMSEIKVSHALIVTGENECVEARADTNQVQRSTLSHYYDDDHCQIFFRKPRDLDETIAGQIVAYANSQVGTPYDFSLIASHALTGSFLGHLINKVFMGSPERIMGHLANHERRWICSELAAYCLDNIPKYHDKGILSRPEETIDPQELFEDNTIFEPWKQ